MRIVGTLCQPNFNIWPPEPDVAPYRVTARPIASRPPPVDGGLGNTQHAGQIVDGQEFCVQGAVAGLAS